MFCSSKKPVFEFFNAAQTRATPYTAPPMDADATEPQQGFEEPALFLAEATRATFAKLGA